MNCHSKYTILKKAFDFLQDELWQQQTENYYLVKFIENLRKNPEMEVIRYIDEVLMVLAHHLEGRRFVSGNQIAMWFRTYSREEFWKCMVEQAKKDSVKKSKTTRITNNKNPK